MIKLRKLLKYLMSYIPQRLPVGVQEADKWMTEVLALSAVPDNKSTRYALAIMVVHEDSKQDTYPMRRFVKGLNKAAANEVAHNLIIDIKEENDRLKAESARVQEVAAGVVSETEGNGV